MSVEVLLRELKEQIDRAAKLSAKPDVIKQIRVTELIPEGLMFLSPCAENGEPLEPFSERTLDDGGSREILMHPADLKRIIDTVWEERMAPTLRKEGLSEKYIAANKERQYRNADNWKLYGIPIVDARIKIRDLTSK